MRNNGFNPTHNAIMNTTVRLDKAGRVVLPKSLRDELHLETGDTLELNSEGENVTLRPMRSKSPLHKKEGVWVFQGGKTLTTESVSKVIADVREARDAANRRRGK
jgi:AbrB family looped-hinge helix DNA binding protein